MLAESNPIAGAAHAPSLGLLPQILHRLPREVIQCITSWLTIADLKVWARVNQQCRYYANEVIYRNIAIVDDDNYHSNHHSQLTYCHVRNINQLISSLDETVFHHMRKMQINCQSCLEPNNYNELYQVLHSLLQTSGSGYRFQFLNYDWASVEKYQCLNQYISSRSIEFNPYSCCYDLSETNLGLLSNTVVFQRDDINQLAIPTQLNQMSMMLSHGNSCDDSHLNWESLQNLNELYLNTHESTVIFVNYSARTDVVRLNSLLSLSVTFSHTTGSSLSVSQLTRFINLCSLRSLELRLDCTTRGCACITEFMKDLNQVEMSDLTHLIINNFKPDCRSAAQYKALLHHIPFHLSSVKSLNISINSFEFSDISVSISKLIKNLKSLTQIEELIIPDTFNSNWLSSNRFENLLTGCDCSQCDTTRQLFNHLSYYDSKNNYRHDFKSQPYVDHTSSTTIIKNHSNIRFLQYLIAQLKLQYKNNCHFSMLENNQFVANHSLAPFKLLFQHCHINSVVTEIKTTLPSIRRLSLGGIVV